MIFGGTCCGGWLERFINPESDFMGLPQITELLDGLHSSTLATLLVASMLPTYLLLLLQAVLNRPLKTAVAPRGIVSLQLAGTAGRAREVIDSWDDAASRSARHGVWLDYLYLVSYAAALVLGCVWAARQLAGASVWMAAIGPILAWLVVLAAVFDAIENLALLVQLSRAPGAFWAALSWVCAWAKFLLAGLGVVYVLSAIVLWVSVNWAERLQIVVAVAGAAALIHLYLPSLSEFIGFAFRHAALVLVALLIYAMVYGQLGADYGIVSLFWSDQVRTRISASLGATLLLADLGIIVFLVAPELAAAVVGPPPWNDGTRTVAANLDYLLRFLIKGGLPFVVLLLAPAALPAAFPAVPRLQSALAGGFTEQLLDFLIWASGIALGAAVPLLLLFFVRVVYDKWLPGGSAIEENPKVSIATFYLIFTGLYAVFAGPLYKFASPAFAICVLLGVLLMAYALIQYFISRAVAQPNRWPVPAGALLVGIGVLVYALVNNDPYKLRFPNMADYYPGGHPGLVQLRQTVREQDTGAGQVHPPATDGASLIGDQTALQNWLARVTPAAPAQAGAPKPKLAIVSVSGGAARSAFWVALVLDRLESQIPGFGRHVRIITGASGGMVGAAFYIKLRRDRLESPDAPAIATSSTIPLNSITPVAAYVALRDVWLALLPGGSGNDRGIVLERDWSGIDFPIRSLRGHEEQGEIPSIILSPMLVEDGRRLLISNLDLAKLTASSGSEVNWNDAGSRSHLYSLSAVEFFRLFPRAADFHLATGVRMSASFPYVSPAVNLPTDPPRRVVDAGYYDNYGIQLAAAWAQTNADWLIEKTSGVVLVQIRDAINPEAHRDVADAPTGFWATVGRSFQFVSSPVEAALQARDSAGLFRNDQDVQTLSDLFTDKFKRWARENIKDSALQQQALDRARAFFTTVVFESSAEVVSSAVDPEAEPDPSASAPRQRSEVALDWYLSEAEQAALKKAINVPLTSTKQEERRDHIRGLQARVKRSGGRSRSHWLNRLRTAQNAEQLIQLENWWGPIGPPP
jgi:hypothetical protein